MANYGVYVPWELLKEYIPIPTNQDRDDRNLFRICVEASAKLEAHCFRKFYPRKETRYYDDPAWLLNKQLQQGWRNLIAERYSPFSGYPVPAECDQIDLDDDLLEVSLFTTDNGATTILPADYILTSADNNNITPYNSIALLEGGSATLGYDASPQKANAVTGFWGYHERWADAWVDSQDTTENNPLSSSATSITVNDVNGLNLYGLAPRFMVQQLLKIESEYLFVTGKNTNTNILTVIRGVNGTTAAAHAQNTPIYIYQPMDAIAGAMKVLATYVYRRRESIGSQSDQGTAANGVLTLPSTLPKDVTDMIDIYKRWTKN